MCRWRNWGSASRRSIDGRSHKGLETDQVRQFKQLQGENARLKRLVAELTLDRTTPVPGRLADNAGSSATPNFVNDVSAIVAAWEGLGDGFNCFRLGLFEGQIIASQDFDSPRPGSPGLVALHPLRLHKPALHCKNFQS